MPTKQEKSDIHPVDTLGQFEQLVLTSVVTLGERKAYGLAICDEVQRIGQRLVTSLGSIYTTLDRLEKKGLVSSWFAEATTERGGRPRKYFKIEAAGQAALENAFQQAAAMSAALRAAEGIA